MSKCDFPLSFSIANAIWQTHRPLDFMSVANYNFLSLMFLSSITWFWTRHCNPFAITVWFAWPAYESAQYPLGNALKTAVNFIANIGGFYHGNCLFSPIFLLSLVLIFYLLFASLLAILLFTRNAPLFVYNLFS